MSSLAERLRKALHPRKEADDVVRTPGQKALLFAGSCAYVGYLPASGTVSVALVGIPVHALLLRHLEPIWYTVFAVAFTLASVWLHGRGDDILAEKDSGKLVWDELAGYFIAVAYLPGLTWQLIVLAFLMERVIDILKVPPANWFEDHAPRGWGVVLDDVMAGVYTCLALHGLIRLAPGWLGL